MKRKSESSFLSNIGILFISLIAMNLNLVESKSNISLKVILVTIIYLMIWIIFIYLNIKKYRISFINFSLIFWVLALITNFIIVLNLESLHNTLFFAALFFFSVPMIGVAALGWIAMVIVSLVFVIILGIIRYKSLELNLFKGKLINKEK